MRLLNAHSLKFGDFRDEAELPPYVILSHTWDETQEVTFQDIASPYPTDKKGYAKISNTCRLARERNVDWIWIDTCCIDKSNNTELTEAINSMFRWYQIAQVCVVHLADFIKTPLPQPFTPAAGDLSGGLLTQEDSDKMAKCTWFYRGWTLQELLAPGHIEFYDSEWTHIGNKAQLGPLVSHITHIPEGVILGQVDIAHYSTAQRMAWASTRVTTKVEDAAYCLFGLFDVNMHFIYGERHRAFERLQEQILKQSTDFTIFGWMPTESEYYNQRLIAHDSDDTGSSMPLLASSPQQFRNCYDLERFRNDDSEFSITNRGLRMTAYLVLIPLNITDAARPINNVRGKSNVETTPNRAVTVPQHALAQAGVGLGLTDHGQGHSTSSPALSTVTSSGSLRNKPSSQHSHTSPRQHRYRYVLTVGRRKSDQLGRSEVEEIGICLRKTGPGELVREGNRALEVMSQLDLRTRLNTTETHTFYITLRPYRSRNLRTEPKQVPHRDLVQTPSLYGQTPSMQQEKPPNSRPSNCSDLSVKPPHPALHLWTQASAGNSGRTSTSNNNSVNILDSADLRSSPTTGFFSPLTPPLNTAPPSAVLKFSDLTSTHPLRIDYHPRLLRGVYIPSFLHRGIVFSNFHQKSFDERLRIYCLPESASEVVSFSCMAMQSNKDSLKFSVLIDFRQGRSHPQCKVVDRSTIQTQFFFALTMRSQSEPIRWYMADSELPEISRSTNKLRITTGGPGGPGASSHGQRTYEIVASALNEPVSIDNYLLYMPTLDIKVTNVTTAVG